MKRDVTFFIQDILKSIKLTAKDDLPKFREKILKTLEEIR